MTYRIIAAALLGSWLINGPAAAERRDQKAPACALPGSISALPELHEASGLAAGREHKGVLWSHNDSGGEPALFAFATNGKTAGKVAISGATAQDWEALTIGPCGKGSCLFIGDIGDNDGKRADITIYRVAEPAPTATSASAEAIRATYPDGAQNAEALFATPDGTLVIVTKGDKGQVAAYRLPSTPAGQKATMQKIGTIGQKASSDQRVTDGAMSADGRWVVLRTRTTLTYYPAEQFMRGEFRPASTLDLRALKEPQGEAVAFGVDGTIYVAGEGGGKQRAGTLAVLSCQ